ncbi:MAG: hypothetical protein ACXAEU_19955 [Candidatus Hodarchaeales archaeon]|jgi:hypothetical protein
MNTSTTSEQSEIVLRISRFLNVTIFTLGALVVATIIFYMTFLDGTIQNFVPVMTTGTIFVLTWVFKVRIESPDARNHMVIFLQWFVISLVLIAVAIVIIFTYPIT